MSDTISDAINKLVKQSPDRSIVGTVKSVTGILCDIEPVDDTADLTGIRLCAADSTSVFVLIPVVGSTVYVTMDSDTGGIVTGVSEVDEVYIRGDAHGGLVKVTELVADLNSIKSDINTIKSIFAAWVPVPGDGGLVLKTASSVWSGSALANSTVANLQNENVKHG